MQVYKPNIFKEDNMRHHLLLKGWQDKNQFARDLRISRYKRHFGLKYIRYAYKHTGFIGYRFEELGVNSLKREPTDEVPQVYN